MTSTIKKYLIMALSVLFALTIFVFAGSVAGDTVAKADTTYATFTMENGAQVRTDNQRAIRFVSKIDIDDLDSLTGTVKVVTMITPLRYLKSANLNSEAGFVKDAEVNMKLIEFSAAKGNLTSVSDGTYYYFRACLYGIQEHNVPYAFAARSYIEQDGTVLGYTPYSETNNARSIYECAKSTIENGLYEGDVEFDNLSALCKDYTVNVFSDQFADLSEIQTTNSSNGKPVDKSITVKTGSRITDYYADMYVNECITVKSIVDMSTGTEFSVDTAITSDLDLKITYDVKHTLTDNVCDKCGFTMVENCVPDGATTANWTAESQAVVSTMTIADGVTVYNYVMDSTDTPAYSGLTLNVSNPNYAYLTFDLYLHSYKEDGNYNGMTMNYVQAGYNGKGMTFYTKGGANDGAIVSGNAIAVGQWYTCILDLSYLGVTAETSKTLLIRPTQGDKSGVGMYLTNSYFVEKEANIPENSAEATLYTEVGANGGFADVLAGSRLYKKYWVSNPTSARAAELQFKNCANYDVITFEFLFKSSETANGTNAGAYMHSYIYMSGVPVLNNVIVDKDGKSVSASDLLLDTWYVMYIDLSVLNSNSKNDASVKIVNGTTDFELYISAAYMTKGDFTANGETFKPAGNAYWNIAETDGEITYIYRPYASNAAAYNRRLSATFAAGTTTLSFDYMYSEYGCAEGGSIHTPNGFQGSATYKDMKGNAVANADLKTGVWYTATITVANNLTSINIYPLTQESNLVISATLYIRNVRTA